jgi:hypothetical protein
VVVVDEASSAVDVAAGIEVVGAVFPEAPQPGTATPTTTATKASRTSTGAEHDSNRGPRCRS